jgi:phospholipase C
MAGFPSGTAVTLTAAPNASSTFTGWSGGGCTGTATCAVTLNAATTVTATFNPAPVQLTVQNTGTGTGSVSSEPAGITCGTTCSASFPNGTSVTLTATPATGSAFAGWSGACTGAATCVVDLTAAATATATFNTASLSSINHIIVLAQENRSFDSYFGALREYWAQNGYPDQSFDGLPQFNPKSGIAPLYAPAPSLPGCNPLDPPPSDCIWDPQNPVTSFHMISVCNENTSPSWNEAHVDWNFDDQVGKYPAKNNGFVWVAGHDSRNVVPPYNDVNGIRAMGYYDGSDLNYYYFMASNFATSDRFFQPEMSRTNPNHEYLVAATSGGYVYPNGSYLSDTALLSSKTIYEDMQDAGVSWKIYVHDGDGGCTEPNPSAACLMNLTYLKNFTYFQTVLANYPQHIDTIEDYFNDLKNGTLPQVAVIEPASDAGLDEHGTDLDTVATNIQSGARYVTTLINGLMGSTSWNDSVFIITYDESGGLYDHVAPQPTVSPDGIKPSDLQPEDVCSKGTGPTCDFVYTGYRIPLLVISPFSKKNYVSHTVADSTAILKFIETRFNLPALNKRDAAQPDMTEFFDFANPPWMTPPTPPVQNTSGPCYLTKVP